MTLDKNFTKKLANEDKSSAINPPNLTQNEQDIEKIIARKKDAVSFMKMNNSQRRRRKQI